MITVIIIIKIKKKYIDTTVTLAGNPFIFIRYFSVGSSTCTTEWYSTHSYSQQQYHTIHLYWSKQCGIWKLLSVDESRDQYNNPSINQSIDW